MRPSPVTASMMVAGILVSFAACVGGDPTGGGTAPAPDGGPSTQTDANVPGNDAGGDSSSPDADAGPEPPRCNPAMPFGPGTITAGINTPDHETGFTMSSDELVAVMTRTSAPGQGEIVYTTRTSRNDPFPAPTKDKVGNLVVGSDGEDGPTLGFDGLVLYFHRSVTSPATAEQIRFTTRSTRTDPFVNDETINVGGSPLAHGVSPFISRDGLRLYYTDIDGDSLKEAKRSTSAGFFEAPVIRLTGATNPVVSKDQKTVYFNDINALNGPLSFATRADLDSSFGTPQKMPAGVDDGYAVHITDDDCILYFVTSRVVGGTPAGLNVYEARRGM